MNDHSFETNFFSDTASKKNCYLVPIFVLGLSSGTVNLGSYIHILEQYKKTRIPIYFVLTHLKETMGDVRKIVEENMDGEFSDEEKLESEIEK